MNWLVIDVEHRLECRRQIQAGNGEAYRKQIAEGTLSATARRVVLRIFDQENARQGTTKSNAGRPADG